MNVDFINIRKEFLSFWNSLGSSNEPKLINYAFRLENFNSPSLINKLSQMFDDIFIFRSPHNKLSLIAINSVLEFTNSNSKNFPSAFKKFNYWKSNFVNYQNQFSSSLNSIICCYAKFDPSKSYSLWKDFNSLRIYVPEIVFSFSLNEVIIHFNFLKGKENSINDAINKFDNFIKIVSEINSSEVESTGLNSSILSEENNNEIQSWNESVTKALKELGNGSLKKLVLSRVYNINLDSEINWDKLLQKLISRFPDCYLFFVKNKNSIFFGSSPEMFLKVTDQIAEVESVAGSAPRGEKSESDYELEKNLKASDKNHQEHLFVSDFISDILIRYSNDVRIIEEKQIRKLDNIQHLITRISAVLNTKENLFELIDSLFPTPALCGVPKNYAMELIRSLEKHDRGLYSGIVGVMDFENNCELAVSIRSALASGKQVTAFAGAGLLKNSDPAEELIETNLKLDTILSLFGNENKS